MSRRPTRTDLLAVIGSLQSIIGQIGMAAGDRNPNRAAHIEHLVKAGHSLCVEVRDFDPPDAGARSKWARRVDLEGVS